MDNNSVIGAARQRWWIIALMATIGALMGALPAPARVEQQSQLVEYTARHTMLLNSEADRTGSTAVSPNQVPLLATTGEVPRRVAEQISFSGNPALLASQVTVNFDFTTGALTVDTTQPTAEGAEQVANAFADTLNTYLIERQDVIYQDRVATARTRLDELQTKLDTVTAQLASAPDDPALLAQRDAISRQYSVAFEQDDSLTSSPAVLAFTTLERAQAIEVESRSGGLSAPRSRTMRGLMGLFVGAAVGLGLVVLVSLIDRRIRTREQAEAVMGTRARVVIPKVKADQLTGLVVKNGRHDPLSDSYRTLRNVIGFVQNGLEPVSRARITVVVSPGPAEGKTSLAANLAAAFVEMGQRTIVVNTDFRRPRLARAVTGSPVAPHLFTIEEIDDLDPEWLLSETSDPNLMILDFNRMASPGELVRATARILPKLTEVCDAIVVDTSPLGATAEPLEMVPLADVIVFVSRLGQTTIDVAQRSIATLRDLSTSPILLVLTGVTTERVGYYEYTDRRGSTASGLERLRRRLRARFRTYQGPERRQNARSGSPADRAEQAQPTTAAVDTESEEIVVGGGAEPLVPAVTRSKKSG